MSTISTCCRLWQLGSACLEPFNPRGLLCFSGAETRRLLQTGTSREVSAAISASRNATQAARSLIADFQAGRRAHISISGVSAARLARRAEFTTILAPQSSWPGRAGSSPDLAAVAGYLDGQPYTPYILGHIAGHAAENASESGQVSATLASAGMNQRV